MRDIGTVSKVTTAHVSVSVGALIDPSVPPVHDHPRRFEKSHLSFKLSDFGLLGKLAEVAIFVNF